MSMTTNNTAIQQLKTPILFLIFNRLDTTQRVFAEIKKQQPKYLYLASDGPRETKTGEKGIVQSVRDYVLGEINWPCEVKTLFREENLGCGRAVSLAITWFFENVEEGIILEDDCLPHSSFFNYCEVLLAYYRDNVRIMHIAGFNPLGISDCQGASYYFAQIQHCWGWASWRRAWNEYCFQIKNYQEIDYKNSFKRKYIANYWCEIFRKMQNLEIDTWDYQWTYAIIKNKGLCINPAKNLVSNIGFSQGGTHTFNKKNQLADNKIYSLEHIKHSAQVILNEKLTHNIYKKCFGLYTPLENFFMEEIFPRLKLKVG